MTTAQFSRDDILIYQGREEGREEGRTESRMEDILGFLEDIGNVSDSLRNLIMGQTDVKVLQKWLKAAARAESIGEFEQTIGLAGTKN